MVPRNNGIAAALLGVAFALASHAPTLLTARGGFDVLPQVGTTGETVMVYVGLSRGVAFAFGTLAVLALGYRAGRRIDLRAEYRDLALAVGLGGAAGYVLVLVPLAATASGGWASLGTSAGDLFGLAALGGRIVGVGVQFAVVGFAGAALAHVADGADGRTRTATGDGADAGSLSD